ncbi:J domain-containing protein [Clostridium chromiireducens]|uniref:Chaperone protein DnaJ n=1 Tax=Clostridium chromiireducens TaxID=225345 RepID=A0A1V4ILP6_9CLOT|nr:DnaJ domain-containing protein [Clostridium chromiireducens]OPJ60789.1 chaperone protein DnaJ [Clostridium chromiireducens]RII33170.1 molecular chaperone DnaJ [Clostridium chromiireducens]
MTDYYKILGVEQNASKEEIKVAYEKQVEKLKKEVVNEKRLNQFLNIFDEAYEALSSLEQNQLTDENKTLIINPQEVQKVLEGDDKSKNYIDGVNSKRKGRTSNRKKNNFTEKVVPQNKEKKNVYKKNKFNDKKEEQVRKQKSVEERSKSNTKSTINLIMLPFKILLLPLIAVLTVVIALLQIINIISWIATKLLIVGSISAGAIHLYQVKLGQPMNYNILILAASVLIASFFLPYILKFVLKALQTLNNVLKDFVF